MSIVDNGQRGGGGGGGGEGGRFLLLVAPAAETWRDHHFSPFVN